jgi:sortase A
MTATDTTTEIPVVTEEMIAVRRGPQLPRLGRHRRDSQPKPVTPLSQGTLTTLWALVSLGVLALWFVAYALLFSAVQQNAHQRQLYAEFREELAMATAPVGGAIEPGSPIALMQAPGIGVSNELIVEGTASSQLRVGPGHRRDTALPGQAGVSVIYGRSVTFGAPFAKLSTSIPGQTINVTTGQGEFVYQVEGVRREGDPLPEPLADGEGRLTLVGSESSGWRQGWTADSVVLVDAKLTGKAVATPPGRPTSIPPDEDAMAGDKSALMPLVLWLEALLLMALALVWIRVRWGSWQTWVVGLPVIVGLVWGATSCVFVLLPNLL